MYIGIPQLIIIAFAVLGIGIGLVEDGKPKTGNHSFLVVLLAQAIHLCLLWWGGFFGGGN